MDLDDLLYRAPISGFTEDPSNANGLHDQTLVCITDLVDCCDLPHTIRGDWYYPGGRIIEFYPGDGKSITFSRNRGPNENINGRQFYGSVRLYKRYTPPQRGRFHCELPSAADPNVNQTLYANIGENN